MRQGKSKDSESIGEVAERIKARVEAIEEHIAELSGAVDNLWTEV
jgi:hypothetical protein